MRSRSPRATLLLKVVACVALLVSGLPVWASACRPVATSSSRLALRAVPKNHAMREAGCAMPCCAPKTVVSCCPGEALSLTHRADESRLGTHVSAFHVSAAVAHGCVLDTPDLATPAILAVVPTLVSGLPAILPPDPSRTTDEVAVPLARLHVGIVGTDAGPPLDAPAGPDSGRSPPLARR